MKKYRPKSAAASVADKLFRVLTASALGVGWFAYLWGLSLPALTAGVSLGGLFWLCVRFLGKKSVAKREAQMRRMLGGELALDRLLIMSSRHAAFQTALWLTPKYPLEMQRAVEWGVIGELNGEQALMRLISQHESQSVTAQQIVEAVRETNAANATHCLLCATAPLSRDAAVYLPDSPIPITLVEREELAMLAGLCSPATDEDLSKLSRKSKKRMTAKDLIKLVLEPGRARRYLWYGTGMTALSLITKQWMYPLPAALCLLLFAGCKLRAARAQRSA